MKPIKLRALAARVLELAVPPAVASPWPTASLDEAAALLAHAVLDSQKRHARWRCPPSSWLFPGRTSRLWRLIRPLRCHVATVQGAWSVIVRWRIREAPPLPLPEPLPPLTGPCPFAWPRGVPGPPGPPLWRAERLRTPNWCEGTGRECAVCEPYRSEAPSKRQRGHHAYELGLGALRVLRDPQCRHDPLEKPRLVLAGQVEGTKAKDQDPEGQPFARGRL